jgi:predicted nucleic acid-binding protein
VLEIARDGLLYLDTSALMKLVVDEDETAALREELARWGEGRLVTSALTKVELPRAISRTVPPIVLGDRLQAVTEILESLNVVPLTDGVLAVAAMLPPPMLRSLDAIHLASAQGLYLNEQQAVVCGYDRRLQAAAAELGLMAISPN